MKRNILPFFAIIFISSFMLFISCGDDKPTNPDDNKDPVDEKNYLVAQVSGDAAGSFSSMVIEGSANNGIISLSGTGTLSIGFSATLSIQLPTNVTGTFEFNSQNYMAELFVLYQDNSVKYFRPAIGTISIEVNDSKKVKGTFQFNAKRLNDDTQSVNVTNGKFLFNL